jgi:hypothetical protein
MRLTLRLANIVALCIAVAWLARTPQQWEEPLGLAIALLVTIVVQEIRVETSTRREDHDAALYGEFLRTFPFEESIRFLKEHDFSAPFHWNRLDDLLRFNQTWRDARHTFLDTKLEASLERLRTACSEYRAKLLTTVFPCDAAPAGRDLYELSREWSKGQRMRAVAELHRLGDEVVGAHQALVHAGKRRLGGVTPKPPAVDRRAREAQDSSDE